MARTPVKAEENENAEEGKSEAQVESKLHKLLYNARRTKLKDKKEKWYQQVKDRAESKVPRKCRVKAGDGSDTEDADEGMEGFVAPLELEYVDDSGRLPLHIAVQAGTSAPYSVVEAIVRGNPKACSVPWFDDLPLHMACSPVDLDMEPLREIPEGSDVEKTIRLLMNTCPQTIFGNDNGDGTTALHLLLEHGPSESLVREMIELSEAHRQSSRKSSSLASPSLLSLCDCQGQLPLHVAISYYASEAVIMLLLKHYREASAVAEKTKNYLPLHFATLWGCTPSVLNELLDANPMAVGTTCQTKETPLHLIFGFYGDNVDRWEHNGEADKRRRHFGLMSEENMFRDCVKAYSTFRLHKPSFLTDLLRSTLDDEGCSILGLALKCAKKKQMPVPLMQYIQKVAYTGNALCPDEESRTHKNQNEAKFPAKHALQSGKEDTNDIEQPQQRPTDKPDKAKVQPTSPRKRQSLLGASPKDGPLPADYGTTRTAVPATKPRPPKTSPPPEMMSGQKRSEDHRPFANKQKQNWKIEKNSSTNPTVRSNSIIAKHAISKDRHQTKIAFESPKKSKFSHGQVEKLSPGERSRKNRREAAPHHSSERYNDWHNSSRPSARSAETGGRRRGVRLASEGSKRDRVQRFEGNERINKKQKRTEISDHKGNRRHHLDQSSKVRTGSAHSYNSDGKNRWNSTIVKPSSKRTHARDSMSLRAPNVEHDKRDDFDFGSLSVPRKKLSSTEKYEELGNRLKRVKREM